MWSRGSQAFWLARCPQLGEGTRFGSLMKRVFLVVCVVSVDGRRLIQDGEQRERAAASLLDFEAEAELSAPRVFVATMASLSPAAAFSAARAVRVRDHVPETGLGALPARARAAVLRRPRLCEEWPDGACVRRTLNSEGQSKSVRAAPATMVAGPKRVEIHATGKNLDSTPGGWVQEVLRNAQEFLLDQRGCTRVGGDILVDRRSDPKPRRQQGQEHFRVQQAQFSFRGCGVLNAKERGGQFFQGRYDLSGRFAVQCAGNGKPAVYSDAWC